MCQLIPEQIPHTSLAWEDVLMKGKNLIRREKWRSFRIFCSTEKLTSRHKRFSSVETLAKIPRNSTYVSFLVQPPATNDLRGFTSYF